MSIMRGQKNQYKYYTQQAMEQVTFPDAALRNIGHMVRTVTPIPGYKAVVDINTDHTYAIVKDGYKVVQHPEVIGLLDEICADFPEYGTPQKEMWLSNQMGRMRVRYTFKDVLHEIRPGDSIHPTFEAFASLDTSIRQMFMVGAYRLICTNGLKIGEMIADYKRKHTESLSLAEAKVMLTAGMEAFSKSKGLWVSFTERLAIENEVFLYEALPFSAVEKLEIEHEIKAQGKVIEWNDKEPEKRKVEINAYSLWNILTAASSHKVTDIQRQLKIDEAIATNFKQIN